MASQAFRAVFESIHPGLLSGITFGRWLRLLRHNRFAVSVPRWPRAAVITACSLGNSLGALVEEALFARTIRSVEVEPPLFVLGVWRSGTTYLQNLLALDHRFAYCNAYQTHPLPLNFLPRRGFLVILSTQHYPSLVCSGGYSLNAYLRVSLSRLSETGEHLVADLFGG